jgi:hypothetical protein
MKGVKLHMLLENTYLSTLGMQTEDVLIRGSHKSGYLGYLAKYGKM